MLPVLLASLVLPAAVLCEQQLRQGTQISDLSNYLEDLSLIGTEIACTDTEKECYKLNRVLQPDGKCYMLQHRGPCENMYLLYFNKTKAQRGVYKAECQPWFKCGTPEKMFMAYDQTCYPSELIFSYCNHQRRLLANEDFFGERRCRCIGDDCPPRPVVTQPDEPGRCRLPDLLQLSFPYFNNTIFSRAFPCTIEEHECLKEKKMLHEPSGNCHRLLERGPCGVGEVFVADRAAFKERGQLAAACTRPSCPEGEVRMQFDERCYRREDALNKLCPPEGLVFDVFGDAGCGGPQDVGALLPQLLTRTKLCAGPFYLDCDGSRCRSAY